MKTTGRNYGILMELQYKQPQVPGPPGGSDSGGVVTLLGDTGEGWWWEKVRGRWRGVAASTLSRAAFYGHANNSRVFAVNTAGAA